MDEPFGHLDAQTRYAMQEVITNIWSREKRTVIFVTNNIEEAVFLADRIILLTNCPTNVKREIRIDLPRPRDYVSKGIFENSRGNQRNFRKYKVRDDHMKKVEVKNLTKSFGDLLVLDNVSFDVKEGEFSVLSDRRAAERLLFK